MELPGHYRFSNGLTGWCRTVLDGKAVSINYDDGSYTVVGHDHWLFQGATKVEEPDAAGLYHDRPAPTSGKIIPGKSRRIPRNS